MKRLVDESTDELTRSLLVAGIEHRPAPGNKAQVLVALGAGSAVGLFGSNAFAWLGTTAGKVTAAGVAVGVAGALLVVAPQLEQGGGPQAAVHSGAAVGQARPASEAARPARQPTPAGSLGSTPEPHAAHVIAPVSEGEALLEASEGSASGVTASSAAAASVASASDKAATKKLSSWRERRLAARRKAVLSRAAVARAASSAPSAASPAAASTPDGEAAVASASGPAAGGLDLPGAEKPDLDSEVRLVDDMHGAARRNDREALGRFLARYRETFADGQLKKEVAEFATRLEQSDISRAP
jgi:hypothetical protein